MAELLFDFVKRHTVPIIFDAHLLNTTHLRLNNLHDHLGCISVERVPDEFGDRFEGLRHMNQPLKVILLDMYLDNFRHIDEYRRRKGQIDVAALDS